MSERPEDASFHDAYQSRHDSPAQQKFRRIRPWPVGVVFIQHPEMTEDDIRNHFRLMKRLGFTALKQCQVCRGTDKAKVMHMALDEGVIPWWYGEAGWEDPTPALLEEIGLDPQMPVEELRVNETWLRRQDSVMRERIDREAAGQAGRALVKKAAVPDRTRGAGWVPSVQPTFDFALTPEQTPLFLAWLERQYGTIEKLNDAWNTRHCMIEGPSDSETYGETLPGWLSWEHLASELPAKVNNATREYRRVRDVYRFKAENYVNWLRDRLDVQIEADPNAPVRAGGEMGLFLPFASRGTDMEAIADLVTERGSFYPSFHPAWHFEEVGFETVRPFYMQSSITTDWFKGGWNATWESTGGPQQMTGHKAPFVPAVRDQKPGVTVDEGVMRQLMLSWIAGGYRGFGMWCWTTRTAGWEAGEFGLLDRNNRPTDRAVVAGKIGRACRRLRDELWLARKEPMVGVFQDWDMEAVWAAASRAGRDFFKSEPIRARIGAARALINANVPWEHVTASDLRSGLAGRYKAIILPAALAIGAEVLQDLTAYVAGGGRVVLDAPGAWYDYYGRLLSTDDGSSFEGLFGCRIADYQFSREGNRPWRLEGRTVAGCVLDLQPTSAEVLEKFEHSTSDRVKPAVTRNRLGAGEAIILASEATRACTRPGDEKTERWIVRHALGEDVPPYACNGAIVYRLAAPAADHYFLMNDGEATSVSLDTGDMTYARVENPIDETTLPVDEPIRIEGNSARWLRFVK